MFFEHKEQPLLYPSQFLFRILKYLFYSGIILFVSVAMGTIGYHYYGEIGWVDAFYNACMILTGMGPVAEMKTTSAKIFSSFYALYSGIAFLSIVAIIFAPIAHRFLHIIHLDDKD